MQIDLLYTVNGTKLPNTTDLEHVLNNVYAQAITTWTVQKIDGVNVNFPNGQMTHGGSNAISVFNSDQKAVIKAFGGMEKDALYLFFVENVKGKDGDIAGYMPLQRQAGFIYDLPNRLELIAHELGHGAFNLRHTFSNDGFIAAQGSTDNLMDYKNGTELWMHQWKSVQDPEHVWLSFLEGEEEGEWNWTIIDEKHTRLFNHIYDNNKTGNLYYIDLIDKSTSSTTIPLSYNGEKEKKWISEWGLSSTPENDISDVINNIRNTPKDSIIRNINLMAKGIYVGKYTIADVEYPIAIYSKISIIQNIRKIRVIEDQELDKPENKAHILRGETIKKYLIIAFFENGENEPSLILQVEKFDYSKWQNTMQIWLNYLKIISVEDMPALRLQLFNGDNPFPQDSILLINTNPSMPPIRIVPTGNGFPQDYNVDTRLKIVYKRDGVTNGGAVINNLRNDSSFYPVNDWQTLALNEEWRVDFGDEIRGGTAYLLCRHDDIIDTIKFYIRGTNPTEVQIRNYFTQHGHAYWFLMKLTRQESSLYQFTPERYNNRQYSYTTNWKTGNVQGRGEPIYGPPRGFGLKQLDGWGTPVRHATAQHLWNWQENIEGGIEVLREKETVMHNIRDAQNEIIINWNEDYPDNPVSDSLYIEAGEGIGTTVLSVIEGPESFSVTPAPANNHQHDIYDAVLIKLYNGSLPERYYHKIMTPEDGTSKPYRVINKLNNFGINYVNNICNRPD
jgi:hypothetical protein